MSDPTSSPTNTRAPPGPGWRSSYMWGENEPLISAAVADLDDDSPGDELVVAGEGERVALVTGHHNSWEKEFLHKDKWWLYALDAGDLDPRRAGDEVVSSGWSGIVTLMYREDGEWKTEKMWTAPDYVYNVAIGNLDPDRPGNELVVAGEDRRVTMLFIDGGEWKSKRLWEDDLYIDDVFLYDILPDNPGDEILITGGSRNITLLAHDGDGTLADVRPAHNRTADGWWAGTMFNYTASETIALTAGQWGEAPEGDTPVSVFACANDGSIIEASPDPGAPLGMWNSSVIWKDRETLYGMAMGDVDPRAEGDEVIAVGWSGNATVLRMDRTQGVRTGGANTTGGRGEGTRAGAMTAETAHEDDGLLYGVAVGDFDPWHPGLEFAVTTSDGDVHKVQYEKEGFGVFPSRDADSVAAGGSVDVPLTVISRGGYEGQVSFTAPNAPEGFDVEFVPQTLDVDAGGTGAVTMYVDASGDLDPGSLHVVRVRAKDGDREDEAEVTITIMFPDAPDFTLDVLPRTASPNADFKASFSVSVGALGGFGEDVNLTLEGEVRGMTYAFAPERVSPPGSATLSITTSAGTPLGGHVLTVVGEGGGLVHTDAVTLDVQVLEKPGFSLTTGDTSFVLGPNGTRLIEINVQSLFGFNDTVTLNMTHDIPGVTAGLSAWSVVPTANVTLNVTAGPELVPRVGTVEVTAESEDGTTKELTFSFELVDALPGFYLEVVPDNVTMRAGEGVEVKVRIVPVLNYTGDVILSLKGLDLDGVTVIFREPAGGGNYTPGVTVRMSIYTSTTTETGEWNATVKGTSEAWEDTVPITVEIGEAEEKPPASGNPWMGLTLAVILIAVTAIMAVNLRRGRGGGRWGGKERGRGFEREVGGTGGRGEDDGPLDEGGRRGGREDDRRRVRGRRNGG